MMQKCILKRIICYTLSLLTVFTVLDIQFVEAATNTRIQSAYIISKPSFRVRVKDGEIQTNSGGSWMDRGSASSTKTVGVSVHTDFVPSSFHNFTGGSWSSEEFDYVGRVAADSSEVQNSMALFSGVSGSRNPYYVGGWSKVPDKNNCIYPSAFNDDLPVADGNGGGLYYVEFSFSDVKNKSGINSDLGAQVGIISAFKYESVKELPSIDWEPEPSEADVSVSAEANGTSLNYMRFSGSVSASATAYDKTQYNGEGELDELSVEVSAFDDRDSNSTKSGDSVTADLSATATKNSDWLYGSSPNYHFYVDAKASVKLKGGGKPSKASANDDTTGYITLENDAPSADWHLQSQNYQGKAVQPDYYYVGVPADLVVDFIDPEDDMSQVQLSIAHSSFSGGNVNLLYEKGNQGNKDAVDNIYIEADNVSASMHQYKGTLTFLKPGMYNIEIYVADANSNSTVRKYGTERGTFYVRTAPEPPVAAITSPAYAFENEPFKVTQNSTDPNGVDDIIRYDWTGATDATQTQDPDEVDEDFKPINATSSWNGKNGGTITFPTGSSHHVYQIGLKVTDATQLWDSETQFIKVISDVPVANLEVTDNNGSNTVKENRKITVSAANSLAPSKSPILWNECTWAVKSKDGDQDQYVHVNTENTNGNKQRELQFSKPGTYLVTIQLVNDFSKKNPTHEDIGASTYTMEITVIEDEKPISEVKVTSAKPNFEDNPTNYTVSFRVASSSPDGDLLPEPQSYSWTIYEDLNDDGVFSSNEIVPQNKLTFNAGHTEVSMQTYFEVGRHNTIKAVVTTTETFAEPTITKFLASDGSWKRYTTVDTTEVINWIPKLEIIPDQGPNTIPTDQPNPDPGTPYEDVDIDGDGVIDGKFIRAYTDDTFSVTTKITDEFPELATIQWELFKKDHSNNYSDTTDTGAKWIRSSQVTSTLGHDGGTLRIDSPGIYILKGTVTDDCGDTGTFTVNIRIYTLPQAVLESNPKYQYFGGEWITKENIRFDLRSDPTIVDDEWGVAWHRMDWSKDCWEITPLEGQDISEIHVMTEDYSGRYYDTSPDDKTKFTGTNSAIGFCIGRNTSEIYRSVSFTEPGLYEFKYWGTNYGSKVTVPVTYTITVQEDLPPDILGSVGDTFYRDFSDGNRANISLLGPYASIINREALTMISRDGDYIDYTIVTVTHDSNNNKLFTDSTDTKWVLDENKTSVNGLDYILKKISTTNY